MDLERRIAAKIAEFKLAQERVDDNIASLGETTEEEEESAEELSTSPSPPAVKRLTLD